MLLVDDDPLVRRVTEVALRKLHGIEVIACSSGQEALERLATERPDVILLDMMMPGMDGRETAAAIRSLPALAAVPIVLLSANHVIGELPNGVQGHVLKPYDPLQLLAQIQCAIQGR